MKRKRHVVRSWSAEEHQFILDNYGVLTAEEMGRILGRTKGSVSGRLSMFKHTGVGRFPIWELNRKLAQERPSKG